MLKQIALSALATIAAGTAWGATTILPATLTPETVAPGEKLTIQYHWEADGAADNEYSVFVHFMKEGAKGFAFQGDHAPSVKTNSAEWNGTIRYEKTVSVPENIAEGDYKIMVGLWKKGVGRLQLTAGKGVKSPGGNTYQVGSFTVKDPSTTTILPATVEPATVAAGGQLKIEYTWQATEPMDKDYRAFVHIFKKGEKKVAFQADHNLPVKTSSDEWNDTVRYEKTVNIPAKLTPGTYLIVAGLWQQGSSRPKLRKGESVTSNGQNNYVIGTFTVE